MTNNGSPDAKFETDDERSYFITTLYVHPEFKKSSATPHVPPHVPPHVTPHVTPHVKKLLALFHESESLGRQEIGDLLGLADRKNMREYYIGPAMEIGAIEYTLPEKPKSRKQKYRLTDLGRKILMEMG